MGEDIIELDSSGDDEGEHLENGKANSSESRNRLSQLLRINQLQKSIVQQNMHNAMSPLSAISGYLELINLALEYDGSTNQIEGYRKKIEKGVKEVNEILEQLNTLYQEEQTLDDVEGDFLEVDFNWTIREVCNKLKIDTSKIVAELSPRPLHVSTALYSTKLIIYKILSYAIKCLEKTEQLTIKTQQKADNAVLVILFKISDHKAGEITKVISCSSEEKASEFLEENSLNEGLYASKELSSQIGGNLDFSYKEEKGRLILSLPLS